MQKAQKRLQSICQKYSAFSEKDYENLDINKKCYHQIPFKISKKVLVLIVGVVLVVTQTNVMNGSHCLVEMPSDASKWFREPEICDICEKVTAVQKLQNVSAWDFYLDYVQPATPVVISDGATSWPALKTFSFDFFKTLYQNNAYDEQSGSCQFFPYKTEFGSLDEALEMEPKRANLEKGEKPWYIGWSNCNNEAGKILRQYYEVPYFLPNITENIALSWIFMGGPGPGAQMHVDNVQYPSWQAQLKGTKLWRLAPPPECYYKCQEMQVVVKPGEINTNRWYHQTFILPGDISITIGSEFD